MNRKFAINLIIRSEAVFFLLSNFLCVQSFLFVLNSDNEEKDKAEYNHQRDTVYLSKHDPTPTVCAFFPNFNFPLKLVNIEWHARVQNTQASQLNFEKCDSHPTFQIIIIIFFVTSRNSDKTNIAEIHKK